MDIPWTGHILRRLEPDGTCFAVVDLVQGFHQIPLHPDSRDLMTIILPQGKFRFTCLPHGLSFSSEFVNILTDPQGITRMLMIFSLQLRISQS